MQSHFKNMATSLARLRPSMRVICRAQRRCLSESTSKDMIRKYGILMTGGPPDHLRSYGDYGQMMEDMLSSPVATNEEWHKWTCFENEFPREDELGEMTGIIITGSRFDAHGTDDWICRLREVIREVYHTPNCYGEYRRILGICFGHQIVSNALGGVSGPTEVGWQLGVQHIDFNDHFHAMFPPLKYISNLPILKLHQDQVHELPPDGTLLASSCNTPIEMYSVGENVLCVQGHPEFETEYLRKVVEHRHKDGKIPDEAKNICMRSTHDPESYKTIKSWNTLLRKWLVKEW